MQKVKFIVLVLTLVFANVSAAYAVSAGSNIESFTVLSKKLGTAVEARDFHTAREVVDQLLPMMKEDIKSGKKTLAGLKKSDDPIISPKEYQKKYDRKIELYNSVKHFAELSPAALRVKSALIVSEVEEFILLMDADSEDS
ncbi:MAG: hypothetical protein JXR03_17055 [Cyclobacteriaceae bacterium]